MSYKFYIKTHPAFSPKTCDKIVQHMSRKEVPKSLVWNTDRAKTQSHSINDSVVVKDIGLFLKKKRGNLKSFAKKKILRAFWLFFVQLLGLFAILTISLTDTVWKINNL